MYKRQYSSYAYYLKKSGNQAEAIKQYERIKEIGLQNNYILQIQSSAAELDTLYYALGDYKNSILNKDLSYRYKDSIDIINKEKEVAALEADNEQQRLARIEAEKAEAKKRRNNIQYIAITIGILSLFIGLVVLGMFKVSSGVIKAIGFIAFLMMFEFLFLLFKKNIYGITHGEPWKDLLAMILLAALLVPLHHWLEHKVIHLLTSQNKLTDAGNVLRARLKKKETIVRAE